MPKEHRKQAEWLASRINHVEITCGLRQVLDGVLLSDGSLQRRGERLTANLRIMQSPRRKGWLDAVRSALADSKVVVRMDSVFRKPSEIKGRKLQGGQYDLLRTLNYAEFVAEHTRWYGTGQKRVPRDLKVTPPVLLHWFCGDGRGGDKKGTLGFCTDGFTEDDVDFLVARLMVDLGVYALRVKSDLGKPQVLVGRRDEAMKIKRILDPIIPPCCAYKLKYVRPLQKTGRGRRLSEAIKSAVRSDKGTCSMRESANRHGVSVSKVWKIWNEL